MRASRYFILNGLYNIREQHPGSNIRYAMTYYSHPIEDKTDPCIVGAHCIIIEPADLMNTPDVQKFRNEMTDMNNRRHHRHKIDIFFNEEIPENLKKYSFEDVSQINCF
jgi:hypothetical protein